MFKDERVSLLLIPCLLLLKFENPKVYNFASYVDFLLIKITDFFLILLEFGGRIEDLRGLLFWSEIESFWISFFKSGLSK